MDRRTLDKTDTLELNEVNLNLTPLAILISHTALVQIEAYLGSELFKTLQHKLERPLFNYLLTLPRPVVSYLTESVQDEWSDINIEILSEYLLECPEPSFEAFSVNRLNILIETQGDIKVVHVSNHLNIKEPSRAGFNEFHKSRLSIEVIDTIMRGQKSRELVFGLLTEYLTRRDDDDNKKIVVDKLIEVFINISCSLYPNFDLPVEVQNEVLSTYAKNNFIPRLKEMFKAVANNLTGFEDNSLITDNRTRAEVFIYITSRLLRDLRAASV